MKIAYVVPMTWACGGIAAPFSQANELWARGHEVAVFAPTVDSAGWFPLRASLLPIPLEPSTDRYDVAVFVGDTFRKVAFPNARRRFLLLQGKDYLWVSGAERAALLRAYAGPSYHILAVSQWLAGFVRDKCGHDRVTVIGNGVDCGRFFPDPQPRGRFRILIEGNFPDANKNVIDAIEVARRVRQHLDVEIWAFGRRFAQPGSLVDKVFEDPPQDRIPHIYRQCDLLIKTSITEGFGLPHLESMACGCVPLTYASGGVLDFCRHDENSLVTGVGNIGLMVRHALRFLADSALRERLRAAAVATARSRPWSRVADILESTFAQMLESRP